MASAKGGTGKTVLTATFGAFLVALGKKVLLIDTDAATNGLSLLYFKEVGVQNEDAIAKNRKPSGIYELVDSNDPAEIVILNSGVHLIPATYLFRNTENIPLDAYKSSLSRTLLSMRDSYDYIFLDAQAGSDPYAQVSISKKISDEVIIVSEYDPMSSAGVERLKGLFREDLTYDRTWLLLNKMLPEFVKSFSDFLEVARYISPIPWDADVVRAYARRRLALDLENGNDFTLAIIQTLKSLLGDTISTELQSWTKQKAALISQPIEDQYKDIEKELQFILKEKYELEKRAENKKIIAKLGFIISSFSTVIILSGIYLHIFLISDWRFQIFFITFSIFTIIFARYLTKDEINKNFYMSESRIRRTQERLENRLDKLDSLRSGDLETLLKYRSGKYDASGNIEREYTNRYESIPENRRKRKRKSF